MSALRIRLQLLRHAEHRLTTDGASIIDYLFAQEGRRAQVVGTQRMGQGNAAAAAAANKARALRAGAWVTVHAAGMERDAGGMGVRLMGIDHVEAEAALAVEVTA